MRFNKIIASECEALGEHTGSPLHCRHIVIHVGANLRVRPRRFALLQVYFVNAHYSPLDPLLSRSCLGCCMVYNNPTVSSET
jgi:hypothetical protein